MSDKLFLFIVGLVAGCTLTGLAVALHKHDEIVMPAKALAEGEPKSGDVRTMVEGKPAWVTPRTESPAVEAEKARTQRTQIRAATKEVALKCYRIGIIVGEKGMDRDAMQKEIETIFDSWFLEANK